MTDKIYNHVEGHGGGGGKSGGGSSSSGSTGVEDPNTLRSRSIAQLVDVLSEGPIQGLVNGSQSIYLDGTPMVAPDGTSNFHGIGYTLRTGTPTQDYMPGFDEIDNEVTVTTPVTVDSGGPITREITNPDLDSVVLAISIPGLTSTNTSNGDIHGTSVEFKIEMKPSNGNWQSNGYTTTAATQTSTSPGTALKLPARIPTGPNTANLNTGQYYCQYKSGINSGFYYYFSTADAGKSIHIQYYDAKTGLPGNLITTIPNRPPNQQDFSVIITTNAQYISDKGVFFPASNFQSATDATNLTITIQQAVSGTVGQTITKTLQAEYRKVGGSTWTALPAQTATTKLTATSGFVSATFTVSGLVAAQYEVAPLQGDFVSSFTNSSAHSTIIVTGKCTSPVELEYSVPLVGKAPWLIRVTRITPDSTALKLINAFSWASYKEVISHKLMYSNSAVIGIGVDAELFGNAVPTRGYELYGLLIKIPSNYDPIARTYTGIWDGSFKLAWSNNPAWCLYDLLINTRYGAGIPATSINSAMLYTIGKYCDQLVPDGFGGMEPRFSLNCWISAQDTAYNVINTLVSVFWGMIYWASGAISVTNDSPRTTDVLVGRANVIDGKFSYQGSSISQRHNTVLVTWNDPSQLYQAAVEVVEDNADVIKRGRVPISVYAFGCTTRGQAVRYGRWVLFTEMLETETITYQASFDHAQVAPGMVIGVMDPTRSDVDFCGRSMTVAGTSVTLDRSVTLSSGQTYQLAMMGPDGVIQYRNILNAAGTYTTLTLNSAFSPAPTQGGMWSIFGSNLAPKPFRLLSVREIAKNIFEISGLYFDTTKFAFIEQDIRLGGVSYNQFPTGAIQPASTITAFESLYVANNTVNSKVTVSWIKSPDQRVQFYRVSYSINGGPLTTVTTTQFSYDIMAAQPGTYSFTVTAIAQGAASLPINIPTVTILGLTAPPSPVVQFAAVRQVTGVQLTWAQVTDLAVVAYEIRQGSSWDTGSVVTKNFIGTSIFVTLDDSLNHTFFIKTVNPIPIYSSTALSLTTSVIPPDCPATFTALQNGSNMQFSWPTVQGLGVTYEVRQGASWSTGLTVGNPTTPPFSLLWPSSSATTLTFWIKSLSHAQLYSTATLGVDITRSTSPNKAVIFTYNARTG